MICSECSGEKFAHYDGIYIPCPICDGTGELPDRTEYPGNCPACGEPIKAGEIWCEFHRGAETLENREL